MKKRIWSRICIAAMLAGTTLTGPIYAQDQAAFIEEAPGETALDVKAKYIGTDLPFSTEVGSGEAISLPDGTSVTAVWEGAGAEEGLRAAVIPVTAAAGGADAQAYDYINGRMAAYGEEPYAFYILFYRDGEEVIPSAPVAVTVAVPEGYEEAELYSFGGNEGDEQQLAVQIAGGAWSFSAAGSGYFAAVLETEETETETESESESESETETEELTESETESETGEPETESETESETGEPETESETESETGESESETESETEQEETSAQTETENTSGNGTQNAAQTGDPTNLAGWFGMLVSAGGVFLCLVFGKKRRKAE